MRVNEERLKLFIEARPGPEPGVVTFQELDELLPPEIDRTMLHPGVLAEVAAIVSRGEHAHERRIAKGRAPEHGEDGKLLLLVKKLGSPREVQIDQRGFVDYSHLHLFDNVEPGTVVARLYPPHIGKPGVDAFGKSIASRVGQPKKISHDKTIERRSVQAENGSFEELVSTGFGYLEEDNGNLSVKTELVVRDNLDLRYGNIEFVGSIRVSGDVQPGFKVSADRGVEVSGAVQSGCIVICKSGDVKIHFADDAQIIASGKITIDVAQRVRAEAGGVIEIKKQARESELRSASAILAPSAQIVGGCCYVVYGLTVRELGNDTGISTLVNLSSMVETTAEYSRLAASLQSHDQVKQLLESHLGPYAHQHSRIQLLKADHRAKMEKLLKKLREVEKSRLLLLERKKAMLADVVLPPYSRVSIVEKINAGSVIIADQARYAPTDTVARKHTIRFVNEKREFESVDFEEVKIENEQAGKPTKD